MAEREELKNVVAGDKAESFKETDADSSASEYEEIIEEVTDYSDEDTEVVVEEIKQNKVDSSTQKKLEKDHTTSPEKITVQVEETKDQSIVEKQQLSEESNKVVEESVNVSELSLKTNTQETPDSADKEGESLIPLLQDFLHKNMPQTEKTATENSQVSNKTTNLRTSHNVESFGSDSSSILTVNHNTYKSNTNNKDCKGLTSTKDSKSVAIVGNSLKKLDQLNVPQREDSGTESGEDLRLIAAGIRDKLHMQSDTNLIQEVTTALNRLESSLKEGKDISLDDKKRNALLALVARLQTGLIAPDKFANSTLDVDQGDASINVVENYEETSSPESDAHRTNRQRFAKKRNRISRHTVGVSREELEDARRYMEDMLLMENISNSTTPDSSIVTVTPPNWFLIEKNASTGAILMPQPSNLYRPNQFVPKNIKNTTECIKKDHQAILPQDDVDKKISKRPLSGDYSVCFAPPNGPEGVQYNKKKHYQQRETGTESDRDMCNKSPESGSKTNRFSNKKQLMKRANTIDIPKSKNYSAEFETDSEMEDKGPTLGLKRTVQVSVKQRVRNAVPHFEPKTENDHKFLAFINKQSAKPGLGWNNSRSVSNWTNKFGNIKNTFEVGAAAMSTTGKPPQAPGHISYSGASNYLSRQAQPQQSYDNNHSSNIKMQKSQQEAAERKKRLERERIERERYERENMLRVRAEHQRNERELMEREHIERVRTEQHRREKEFMEKEHIERVRIEQLRKERQLIEREHMERIRADQQRKERENIERVRLEQHRKEKEFIVRLKTEQKINEKANREIQERNYYERERLEKERLHDMLSAAQPATLLTEPMTVNQFIHAPQSVFRPIDINEQQNIHLFKPISTKSQMWQSIDSALQEPKRNTQNIEPLNYLSPKSIKNSPILNAYSPLTTSPIGLPWVSKQSDKTDFRNKASKYEEKPQYQQRNTQMLHRHNSLRSANSNPQQQVDQYAKRPSLPNTADPYHYINDYQPQSTYPPTPTNISFTYSGYTSPMNYQNISCLPSTVLVDPQRTREDSLTNPRAEPLVLTSAKPLYGPPVDSLHPFTPNAYQRQFDYASPMDSAPTSPSLMSMQQTDCTDDDLDSDSNIMEYRVESKVMGKPQSQTAVTVGRRTNHVSDDEVYGRNSRVARNLLYTMKSVGNKSGDSNKMVKIIPEASISPKACLSPDGRLYQAPLVEPLFPQLTNFEPNRSPMTLSQNSSKSTSMQSLPTQYQQNPMYIPPSRNAYPHLVTRSEQQNLAYQKQPQHMLQQRNRNISENSVNSSISNKSTKGYINVDYPNMNWTVGNTMQVDTISRDVFKPQVQPDCDTTTNKYVDELKPQEQRQQQLPQEPNLARQQISVTHKPELRPKPQLPPANVREASATNQTFVPAQPNQQQIAQKSTVESRNQSNIIKNANIESRVQNSQQVIINKEQKVEMRRKSSGNIMDIQQENRKSTAFESQRDYMQSALIQYKSSAPIDTPDIVKSSLPKDENAPILKKFGPPQRHHYVPNSYQNIASHNTIQAKQKEVSNITTSAQRTIHSNVTNKPTIVETQATPQTQYTEDLIPRNIVYNNINAFSSMSRRGEVDYAASTECQHMPNKLSKCDSWSQMAQQQAQYASASTTASKFNSGASGINELRRTKSGHTLTMPKMFEAGIDKSQVSEKQKTVAAYFSAGKKSPIHVDDDNAAGSKMVSTRKSTINRTKTTEKVSTSRKSLSSMPSNFSGNIGGGLARSATMPHIANLNLLDETNVEDAFEQLIMGS